jgi:hypothetical protein
VSLIVYIIALFATGLVVGALARLALTAARREPDQLQASRRAPAPTTIDSHFAPSAGCGVSVPKPRGPYAPGMITSAVLVEVLR